MKKISTLLHLIIAVAISVMMPFNLLAQDSETTTEATWGADENSLTNSGTLTDAITAAAGDDVNYIRLVSDITTTECFYIETGEFTLDLCGHNITAGGNAAFYTSLDTKVTFTDTADEDGTVSASGNHTFYVEGEAIFNGGIYESADGCSVIQIWGNVTIKDGTFTAPIGGAIENEGILCIEGGEIQGSNYGVSTHSESSTTITGGSFGEHDMGDITYDGGFLDLSGHTDITKISVYNNVTDLVPGEDTILLPTGYCFYDSDNYAVSVLNKNETFAIGIAPETYNTISFSANGGIGNMEDATAYSNYKLPECTFTAPEGKMFKAWLVGETEYQPDDVITVTGNTTVTAVWIDYKPTLTIKMKDYCGDGWYGASITIKKNGEEIGTATIESGEANTVTYDYDNTAEYTFYWNKGESDGIFDNECSFEIIVNQETEFIATTWDCELYSDGELVYTLPKSGSIIIRMTDDASDSWNGASITIKKNGEEIGEVTIEEGRTNTIIYDFDETAEYTFYWNKGEFDNECSFEILVDKETVFTATMDNCDGYSDGDLVHTIKAGSIVTAIEDCKIDNSDTAPVIYDLQGRRVSNPGKGIYIINGKKILK